MSRGMIGTRSKKATVWALALAMFFTVGCSIHAQSPIKEVAYDFSDADFYDRDYAASPNYEDNYLEVEAPVVGQSDAVTASDAFVAVRQADGNLVLMPKLHPELVSSVMVRSPLN